MNTLLKKIILISVAGLAVPGLATAQKKQQTFGFIELFNGFAFGEKFLTQYFIFFGV